MCNFRRQCIPREWLCDHEYNCGPFDKSDEDESLCQFKEKCLPNQSQCASPNATDVICIDTEKFCDKHFDCVNDEYTEFCGKNNETSTETIGKCSQIIFSYQTNNNQNVRR